MVMGLIFVYQVLWVGGKDGQENEMVGECFEVGIDVVVNGLCDVEYYGVDEVVLY